MIADVAFDAPVRHSFSYRVPAGWTVVPGQRARAPLRGAARVGMVVAVRDGAGADLKPLGRLLDAEPVLSKAQLELVGLRIAVAGRPAHHRVADVDLVARELDLPRFEHLRQELPGASDER